MTPAEVGLDTEPAALHDAARPLPYVGGWAAVAAAVSMVVMAPVFIRLVDHPDLPTFGVHDFAFHLDLAHAMQVWPPHLTMPHPVFHVFVRLLDPVLGPSASGVVVLLAAIGVIAAALVNIFATPAHGRTALSPVTAAVMAVGYFAMESPNLVLQAVGFLPPRPFTPVHIWGNPTETVAVAAALLLLPALVLLIDRLATHVPVGHQGWIVAALAVTSALAKPALVLVLVPASFIHLATSRNWSRGTVAGLIRWLAVPAGIVVAWQTWFLETGQSPQLRTGFTWDPFSLFEVYGWTRGGAAFWIPTLVPVAALAVGRRRFWSERSVGLTLWALLLAMVPLLFMRETGERAYDGNLAKSGYYCWALLFVLSVRFWALEARDSWRARPKEGPLMVPVVSALVAIVAVLVLASGVLALLGAAGVVSLPDSYGVGGA